MRIAVSSSTFRRPLAAGELTQLEWLERCASQLDADGVLADLADFPRTDLEYTAQLCVRSPSTWVWFRSAWTPVGCSIAMPRRRARAPLRWRPRWAPWSSGRRSHRRATWPPATYVETVAVAKALGRAAKPPT